MYFKAWIYESACVDWVLVWLDSWGSVFEEVRFVLRVFLFSSLALLRVVFFFGLVSYCEMMLLMMISCVNSVLAAFYYGNITCPSHDPLKMGFLSTVLQDAAAQLVSAVATVKMGDNLPCRSLLLPSLSPFFYPPPPYSSIRSGTKRDLLTRWNSV